MKKKSRIVSICDKFLCKNNRPDGATCECGGIVRDVRSDSGAALLERLSMGKKGAMSAGASRVTKRRKELDHGDAVNATAPMR